MILVEYFLSLCFNTFGIGTQSDMEVMVTGELEQDIDVVNEHALGCTIMEVGLARFNFANTFFAQICF